MDQQWWSVLATLLYGFLIVGGLVLGLILWEIEMKRIERTYSDPETLRKFYEEVEKV